MATTTQTTIAVGANDLSAAVNALLPVLSAYIPAVASNAQLVTLGTSALTSLATLIANLPISTGTISVAQQSALLAQIYTILSGSELAGKEWVVQT